MVQRRFRVLGERHLPGDLVGVEELVEFRSQLLGCRGLNALPRNDRTVGKRYIETRQNQLGIKLVTRAKAITFGASPIGTVEAERSRLHLFEADVAFRAGIDGTVQLVFPAVIRALAPPRVRLRVITNGHQAIAESNRHLNGFGQTRIDAGTNDNAVNDSIDVMSLASFEFGRLIDLVDISVDARPDQARLANLGKDFLMLATSAAHQRREQHRFRSCGQFEQPLFNLFGGLLLDWLATVGTMRCPETSHHQAEIVVDLRDRRDGAARILVAGALIDTKRRLEPLDQIDIGTLHLVQELTGVDGQAFDELALALCEYRVKRQTAFARSTRAG